MAVVREMTQAHSRVPLQQIFLFYVFICVYIYVCVHIYCH